MRQIEREIVSAIRNRVDAFGMSNTTITYNKHTKTHDVILHGHNIAQINHKERWVRLSSCGYLTNVTKSRLNCVLNGVGSGKCISQKNHKWYIVGYSSTEEFKDGMKVEF
jgi:hypothetical protein